MHRVDRRLRSPSAQRNSGPIAEVLRRIVPDRGLVLEIASGTGEHVVHFARAMPRLDWQPSDHDPDCLASISAWLALARLPNLREPLHLDVHAPVWPIGAADAVVCINMVHIAPWSATEALLHGTAARLGAGGLLYLYGPYRRHGGHTAASNEAFDAQLRAHNPEWGVRDVDDVSDAADRAGFELAEIIAMPAQNLSVVFKRRPVRP